MIRRALVLFFIVIAACEGEPAPPPAGDCPAAGPCEEGEVPIDCGFCDLDEGSWAPCTTAQEPGERCTGLGQTGSDVCRTCAKCAVAWERLDEIGFIDCPALPVDEVVFAK